MKLINLFKLKGGKEPQQAARLVLPAVEQPRHRCPFYGFSHFHGVGVMVDQHGNQCPLLMATYSPCQMEMRGETPDWEDCFLAGEYQKKTIALRLGEALTVHPDEFPKGILFSDWYRYVMDEATKRPPPGPDG